VRYFNARFYPSSQPRCSMFVPAFRLLKKRSSWIYFAAECARVAPDGSLLECAMFLRAALCIFLVVGMVGCQTPKKKKEKENPNAIKDQSTDTTFQAFLGRLRIAVAKRDRPMLVSMMTQNFGYRWDITTPMPLDAVFEYWDEHNLWPELSAILRERFVPSDLYMVAPPQVTTDTNYRGYRAGMRIIGGSWKFAYFVSGEEM
jgi:hypothetical protein